MTVIKLCGLTHIDHIECVNTLDVNLAGFIFYKKSRRYIDINTARALRCALKPTIASVGVFVNEDVHSIASLYNENLISIAQLHGSEDTNYIARLKELCPGIYIIKACVIHNKNDCIQACSSPSDMLLLDAGSGSGTCFDWSLLSSFTRPYILAGGLNSDNIHTALCQLHPYGVDVSSGIESSGVKDLDKMRVFVSKVRAFDTQQR